MKYNEESFADNQRSCRTNLIFSAGQGSPVKEKGPRSGFVNRGLGLERLLMISSFSREASILLAQDVL
jgi:hypothetical protein